MIIKKIEVLIFSRVQISVDKVVLACCVECRKGVESIAEISILNFSILIPSSLDVVLVGKGTIDLTEEGINLIIF